MSDDFMSDAPGDYEKHDPFRFDNVGDTAVGVLVDTPRKVKVPSLNDASELVDKWVFNLRTDSGEIKTLWVDKFRMSKAIADAVRQSGAAQIVEGGKLAVKYNEQVDVGKPSKAKGFVAKYEPPQQSAPAVTADDLF